MEIYDLKKINIHGGSVRYYVKHKDNKKIGKVTSAVYSPRLKKNIALAIVDSDQSNLDNQLKVEIDGKSFDTMVVQKPFFDPKKQITSAKI